MHNTFQKQRLDFQWLAYLAMIMNLFWLSPIQADEYPHAQILQQSTQTIAGETLHYPQSVSATITTAIITIPAGTSTGWHTHGVPVVGYLINGELDMEYADGKRVTLKQGDAIIEAMQVAHIGANLGQTPATLFVTFVGDALTQFTQLTNAPNIPPIDKQAKASVDLVDLSSLDKRLQFDIRYAGTNNFMGKALYPVARALLQRPAAEALMRAHDRLRKQGYGLLVFDAYRPWSVTREMWDQHPHYRDYLADPLKGSRHNRGCAVDLTLYDLQSGKQVDMPSAYDEFTERAHPDYSGGSTEARQARDLLRAAMESEGFKVYENEWWHFDYQDWQNYPVMNSAL